MESVDNFDCYDNSILTDDSICSFSNQQPDEYCLELLEHVETDKEEDDDEFFVFENITENEQVPDKYSSVVKYEDYKSECKIYNLVPITLITEAIMGGNHLDLKEYGIKTLHCQLMFEVFAKFPVTAISLLDLTNNKFNQFACKSLANFMQISTTLKTLILRRCKFGYEGAELIGDGIKTSTSILALDLSSCNITDAGGEILAIALMEQETCKEVDLSSNNLGPKTGAALENLLKSNKIIEVLILSDNDFYFENAGVSVMRGLLTNETLKFLDLSWNALGGEQFGKVLSKSIKASGLKIIDLSHNRLTSFELKKLAVGLKFCKTIEAAYFSDNLFLDDDDVNLVNVFLSKSPIKLMSFGDHFYLSKAAFQNVETIKATKPDVIVIYKDVISPNPPALANMKDICADRAKFLALKPKKKKLKRDLSLFMNNLLKQPTPYMEKQDLLKLLIDFKVTLDKDLIDEYIEACMDVAEGKRRFNCYIMAKHYLERHPAVVIVP